MASKDSRKNYYQGNSKIRGNWALAKKTIWENISDKPPPSSHKDNLKDRKVHSDLQDWVTIAFTIKNSPEPYDINFLAMSVLLSWYPSLLHIFRILVCQPFEVGQIRKQILQEFQIWYFIVVRQHNRVLKAVQVFLCPILQNQDCDILNVFLVFTSICGL